MSNRFQDLSVARELESLISRLKSHPLPHQINSKEKLQKFCEHHIYAVWDFLSLLQALKNSLSLKSSPLWVPLYKGSAIRFLNEITLAEESDEIYPNHFESHFTFYLTSMRAIGANTQPIETLMRWLSLESTIKHPFSKIIHELDIPVPNTCRHFLSTTFEVIESHDPVKLVGAFCLGREDILPSLFLNLLDHTPALKNAPDTKHLRRYFERHIEVDGEDHGPKSRELLNMICSDDEAKWQSAYQTAVKCLKARLDLWDAVVES